MQSFLVQFKYFIDFKIFAQFLFFSKSDFITKLILILVFTLDKTTLFEIITNIQNV